MKNSQTKFKKFWNKIFPLKKGDKVRINVTNPTWEDFANQVNGKIGIVRSIIKSSFASIEENFLQESFIPNIYVVDFPKGESSSKSFIREELEKIEDN